MAGEIRKLRFSEGTTVGSPSDLSIENEASSLAEYANDAAYVTAKGSAADDGDFYYNTTRHTCRLYADGGWIDIGDYAQYFPNFADDAAYVTNKDSAAEDGDCYYNTATDTVRVYAAGAWTDLGAGGAGGINYITMSDGAEYEDTDDGSPDDTVPDDGTGGSPNVTWAANSSNPLIGAQDYKLSKDAANRQGEGVAFDFTIDKIFKDMPQLMKTKFYFQGSANFAAEDLAVYIYDKDGTNLIQPHTYELNATQGVFETTWQPQAGNDDYRLILHIASTNASAWDLQVSTIETGPQTKVYGPAMTDWVDYEPTFTNFTLGDSTRIFRWRRVGDSIQINGYIDLETTGAFTGSITFSPPDGVVLDNSKFVVSGNSHMVGKVSFYDATGPSYNGRVKFNSTTSFALSYLSGSQTWGAQSATLPFVWAAQDRVYLQTDLIPVAGWSSNTVMSNEGETRIVAAKVTGGGGDTIGTTEQWLQFGLLQFDTHTGMENLGSTGTTASSGHRYTAPVSGYYEIYAHVFWELTASAGTTSYAQLRIMKNSTTPSTGTYLGVNREYYSSTTTGLNTSVAVRDIAWLDAGDTVRISMDSNDANCEFLSQGTDNYFSIERLSGPSSIAASEVVAFKYITDTTGQSMSGGVTNTVQFQTKRYDTHNAFSSNTTFTAPIAGFYVFNVYLQMQSLSVNATQYMNMELYKNGAAYGGSWLDRWEAPSTASLAPNFRGSSTLYLEAGEYVHVNILESVTGTPVVTAVNGRCHFEGHRIGGVM